MASEITTSKSTHASVTKHHDGTTSKHHSVSESRIETPQRAQADIGSLHSGEAQQASPLLAVDPEEGNHYEMFDNGNGNSGAAALARYPRMTEEIGGAGPGTGRDRIQVEHDSLLLHKR